MSLNSKSCHEKILGQYFCLYYYFLYEETNSKWNFQNIFLTSWEFSVLFKYLIILAKNYDFKCLRWSKGRNFGIPEWQAKSSSAVWEKGILYWKYALNGLLIAFGIGRENRSHPKVPSKNFSTLEEIGRP